AGVIRGHAVADQTEGGGEAIEQIDGDLELPVLDLRGAQQGLCRVHAGGPGADHGQTGGLLGGGHLTSVSWRSGAGSDAFRSGRESLRVPLCTDFRTTLYAKFAPIPVTVSGLTCALQISARSGRHRGAGPPVLTPGSRSSAGRGSPGPRRRRRRGCWSPRA